MDELDLIGVAATAPTWDSMIRLVAGKVKEIEKLDIPLVQVPLTVGLSAVVPFRRSSLHHSSSSLFAFWR